MSACEPPSRQACADLIDSYLATILDGFDLPPNLAEAVRYALLMGGKRLRPTLTILSCEAVGGTAQQALPAAAAVEMIHAFSLVHDDLPAMDDDDLRRGRPTCHMKFGQAMAILAGDTLATLPYLVIARGWGFGVRGSGSESDFSAPLRSSAPLRGTVSRRGAEAQKSAASSASETSNPDPRRPTPDPRLLLIAELAEATTGMIAGQVYDTLGGFADDLSPAQRLELTHRNKTGALIRGACRMGAISGGATPDQLDALTHSGESVGLLFQVVDDILDVTQSAEHLGKRSNKDAAAGKLTYPEVLGLDASRRLVADLRRRAADSLAPLGPAARPLIEVCEYLAVRTK